MEIIRGTTPTILYTFNDIDPGDITYAYLLIKQKSAVIEKYLGDASVTPDSLQTRGNISFTLTQQDTLNLTVNQRAVVSLDWKLSNGTRGRSNVVGFSVENSGKNEVV